MCFWVQSISSLEQDLSTLDPDSMSRRSSPTYIYPGYIRITPEVSPTLFCLFQYALGICHGNGGSHVGKCLPEDCYW